MKMRYENRHIYTENIALCCHHNCNTIKNINTSIYVRAIILVTSFHKIPLYQYKSTTKPEHREYKDNAGRLDVFHEHKYIGNDTKNWHCTLTEHTCNKSWDIIYKSTCFIYLCGFVTPSFFAY